MYDGDDLKKSYIMKKISHKGGSKNTVEENRKRITVALNVELSFRNNDLNRNSPPQTNISLIFTCGFMFGHT